MSKSYIVGWVDAFKWILNTKVKTYKGIKLRIKMWRKLLEKKYFWYTKEELAKSNEECWTKIREITKDYPKNFFNYTEEDYED